MFKRPEDKYKDLSRKELEKKYDKFAEENDFSKEDEKALIFAALKTFLPAVIGVCVVFVALIYLIVFIFFR